MAKKVKRYRVSWEIDVYAGSRRQAAETALRIQQDIESIALVFNVGEFNPNEMLMEMHEVDLLKGRKHGR